jgi:hypothetical protein
MFPDAKQNPFFRNKDCLTTPKRSMNQTVKFILYVVLTLALAILGYGLVKALRAPSDPAAASRLSATTNGAVTIDTNQPVQTATTTTNTNLPNVVATAVTNTNTNAGPIVAPTPVATTAGDEGDLTVRKSSRNLGRATAYGVAMFFVFIGLAILIARDVSRYLGGRVEDFIFNDNLEGMKDPEYEEAERIWAKGEHLESVRLMRAYLQKHPREQYVALRIAEIYETDLRNYLAAALEYEEVLKKKLPPERWGWAAIHLANLYSGKLDKIPEATALLHRIVDEYGQTAAAKKARERLGIPPPVEARDEAPEPEPAPEAEPEATTPPPPAHNLPKGFRPK